VFNRRATLSIDDLQISNLDVKFTVNHDRANLGKADISVFNLDVKNRERLSKSGSADVELLVGYADTALMRIFKGGVSQITSFRDPPDWVTRFQLNDGAAAIQKARVAKSFPKEVSFQIVWDALAEVLEGAGVSTGKAKKKFKEAAIGKGGIQKLLSGSSFFGDAFSEIQKLAKRFNLEVGIRDQELEVVTSGGALQQYAVVLGPQSGLLTQPVKGVQGFIEARALIVPGLLPRRKIEFEGVGLSGTYIIEKAKYTGDTSGNDWYVDLQCKEGA
jgi:hypothetical protein